MFEYGTVCNGRRWRQYVLSGRCLAIWRFRRKQVWVGQGAGRQDRRADRGVLFGPTSGRRQVIGRKDGFWEGVLRNKVYHGNYALGKREPDVEGGRGNATTNMASVMRRGG